MEVALIVACIEVISIAGIGIGLLTAGTLCGTGRVSVDVGLTDTPLPVAILSCNVTFDTSGS